MLRGDSPLHHQTTADPCGGALGGEHGHSGGFGTDTEAETEACDEKVPPSVWDESVRIKVGGRVPVQAIQMQARNETSAVTKMVLRLKGQSSIAV